MTGAFCFGWLLNIDSVFLTDIGIFRLFISSMCLIVYFLQGIDTFVYSGYQLWDKQFLIVFFIFYRIYLYSFFNIIFICSIEFISITLFYFWYYNCISPLFIVWVISVVGISKESRLYFFYYWFFFPIDFRFQFFWFFSSYFFSLA